MAQGTPKPMRIPSAAALKHGHSNVTNVSRLLPGGAVLCTSQFSKSIKVMQLLDQQMNTKGKI